MTLDPSDKKVLRDLAVLAIVIGSWGLAAILVSFAPVPSTAAKLGLWGAYGFASFIILGKLNKYFEKRDRLVTHKRER